MTCRRTRWMFPAVATLVVSLAYAPAFAQSAQQNDPVDVTDDEFRLPLDDATAAEVDRLIPQLGSPEYHERERASTRLIAIGAAVSSKLRSAYNQSDDFEARLRIERIVREAYLGHHVFNRTGYLGIRRQMSPKLPTHQTDPRIPVGHVGLPLQEVMPGTSAERAGLRARDLIIALDSTPLGEGGGDARAFGDFARSIRERGVGGKARLTVLRGSRTLELDVTLGPVPAQSFTDVAGLRQLVSQASRTFDIWWTMYFRQPATPNSRN